MRQNIIQRTLTVAALKADAHTMGIASEHFISGYDDESGGIVGIIINILSQHFQSIQLCCSLTADRRLRHIHIIPDLFAGCCRVGVFMQDPFRMLLQIRLALGQRLRMGIYPLDIRQLRSRKPQKLMLHLHYIFIYDRDIIAHQQIIHIRHNTRCRIFNRKHRKIGFLINYSFDRFLKRRHMEAVHTLTKIRQHGGIAVGTLHALKNDLLILIYFVDLFKSEILRHPVFCLDLVLSFTTDGNDLF